MSFRFRKSVQLFPGVRLNFSRSGVSTTIGVRGAGVTIGPRGTYANVGLPGTGHTALGLIAPLAAGGLRARPLRPLRAGPNHQKRSTVFRAMRRRVPTPHGSALMKGSAARRSNI